MRLVFLLLIIPFATGASTRDKADTLQITYYFNGKLITLDSTAQLRIIEKESVRFTRNVYFTDSLVSFVTMPNVTFDSTASVFLEFVFADNEVRLDLTHLIYNGSLIITGCDILNVYQFEKQSQLNRFARKNPEWKGRFYWLYEEYPKENYPLAFIDTKNCGEYNHIEKPVTLRKERRRFEHNEVKRVRNLRN
jgi:hypothetical protein